MNTKRLKAVHIVEDVDIETGYHSYNSRWKILFDNVCVGKVFTSEIGTIAYYEPFENVWVHNEVPVYMNNPIPGFISAIRKFIKSDAFTKRQKKKAIHINDYYNKEVKYSMREEQRKHHRVLPSYIFGKMFIDCPLDRTVTLNISESDFHKCNKTFRDGYVILSDSDIKEVKGLEIQKGNIIKFIKKNGNEVYSWKKLIRVKSISFENFGIVLSVTSV